MDILRIKIEELLEPSEECKLVVELSELIIPSGSTFIENRRKIYLSIVQRSQEKHCTAFEISNLFSIFKLILIQHFYIPTSKNIRRRIKSIWIPST